MQGVQQIIKTKFLYFYDLNRITKLNTHKFLKFAHNHNFIRIELTGKIHDIKMRWMFYLR